MQGSSSKAKAYHGSDRSCDSHRLAFSFVDDVLDAQYGILVRRGDAHNELILASLLALIVPEGKLTPARVYVGAGESSLPAEDEEAHSMATT